MTENPADEIRIEHMKRRIKTNADPGTWTGKDWATMHELLAKDDAYERQHQKRVERLAKESAALLPDIIHWQETGPFPWDEDEIPIAARIAYRDTIRRFVEVTTELLPLATSQLAGIHSRLEATTKRFADEAAQDGAARRAERIAARPEPVAVEMGTRCSVCQKKPARIDDLCKKCARAAGIIVHGKIGGT